MDPNATFIPKLFHLVNDPNISQIHWSESGTFFIVPNPDELAEKILSTHFSQSNFASFVRQLNMYNFRKVADLSQINSSGLNRAWAFEHPHFMCSRPDLLPLITRKPKPSKKKLLEEQSRKEKEECLRKQTASQEFHQVLQTQQRLKKEIQEITRQSQTLREDLSKLNRETELSERLQEKLIALIFSLVSQNLLQPNQIGFLNESDPESDSEMESNLPRSLFTPPLSDSEVEGNSPKNFFTPLPSDFGSNGFDFSNTLSSEDFPPPQEFQDRNSMETSSPRPLSPVLTPMDDYPLYPPSSPKDDFCNYILRFEEGIIPFCSMEEDRIGLNQPLNWVPS